MNVPYSYGPQPAASAFGAPPAFPPPVAPAAPSPFGWEQGAYGFETVDGSTVTYQHFCQGLAVESTFLYGDGSADALGWQRLELSSTLAFPMFGNIKSPLLVTPGFAFNWIEGPVTIPDPPYAGADLPPRVYDAYLDFAWRPQPTPMFGAELGFRTGVWTDFSEVNSDSVRFIGRGVGKVRVSPKMEVLVGAAYLDRLRIKLLPVAGIRYRPNEVWDLYLVFPNPIIRRRMTPMGAVDWTWFAAAEYGGGSWTVSRLIGPDRFDYNDIRITTGFEWENSQKVTGHFEFGVAFDREIIYQSNDPPSFYPDTTLLLRCGVDF